MKVIAINGSSRKNGNTRVLLTTVLGEMEKEGAETRIISLAGRPIQGCLACYKCLENKDGRCAVEKDGVNGIIEAMREADGILLGSPTYFSDVSASMKGLIERAGMVARVNGNFLDKKAGAAVVAVRRAGANHVMSSINYFFLISSMFVVGSSYWPMGFGMEPGAVEKDVEGMETMRVLGRNMAWLLKKTQAV
ncbi:MAG: flavodoxin family protein [Deltaproteobacteria bacterium]|nr:flavodoxin family protein [Deltaproteobacteria bacterium]